MDPVPPSSNPLSALYACKTKQEAYTCLTGDGSSRLASCAGVALGKAAGFHLVCAEAVTSPNDLPDNCAM